MIRIVDFSSKISWEKVNPSQLHLPQQLSCSFPQNLRNWRKIHPWISTKLSALKNWRQMGFVNVSKANSQGRRCNLPYAVSVLGEQSCYQIEISPEFGGFSGAFLGTFDKKRKKLWYFLKKSGAFQELLWVLFDKYVEILCYFRSFFNVLVSFGSFFGRFWPILK